MMLNKLKKPLLVGVAFLGAVMVFVGLIYFIIYVETRNFIYQSVADVPNAQAVLVLGAGILDNNDLSFVLKDRVDLAIVLYEAGKVQKILVTGDNSTLMHNEVNPIRKYLLAKNIPDEDIFLDHAGFDTYSSMYRARDVFLVSSIIIATQSFHLPRAVYVARHLGIEAYGVNADNGHYLLRNYVRGIFANTKAVFDLTFFRIPKYLGETYPISGNGKYEP